MRLVVGLLILLIGCSSRYNRSTGASVPLEDCTFVRLIGVRPSGAPYSPGQWVGTSTYVASNSRADSILGSLRTAVELTYNGPVSSGIFGFTRETTTKATSILGVQSETDTDEVRASTGDSFWAGFVNVTIDSARW